MAGVDMKKTITMVLSAVFALGMPFTVFAEDTWQDAYRELIDELGKRDLYPDFYYDSISFYDIDDNGIPEMIYYPKVYTYQDGDIIESGEIGTFRVFPKENGFISGPQYQDTFGEQWISEFQLVEGKVTPDFNTVGDRNGHIYTKKEALVSYSDYRDWPKAEYMFKGKTVNDYDALMNCIKKYSAEVQTFSAYEIRGQKEKSLTAYVTKRYKQAIPSEQNITVNGKAVRISGYLIDGSNFCKLRDIAYLLRDTDKKFDVTWHKNAKKVEIRTGQAYTGNITKQIQSERQAVEVYDGILCDGGNYQVRAYNIDGNNYMKLRDIIELLQAEVVWNAVEGVIQITA